MQITTVRSMLLAGVATLLASSAAMAQGQSTYSEKIRNACTADAMRLCSEHMIGSTEMRYCMEAKHRNLSRDCIVALEDEGIVPRNLRKSQAQR